MKWDGDDWIRAVRPPGTSAALRDRVLAASRAASPRLEREGGVVDRIWESRGARWGWALLVSAFLLGHVVVSMRGGPDAGVSSTAQASPPTLNADEAALPALAASWLTPHARTSRLRVIDVMFDPTVAGSLSGEAP